MIFFCKTCQHRIFEKCCLNPPNMNGNRPPAGEDTVACAYHKTKRPIYNRADQLPPEKVESSTTTSTSSTTSTTTTKGA